ncbi:MAG TPA: hypothetical protein VGQ81_08660 [Acidobacteriota bacterium]|nr:hypothetical protein [Acidobacteriota bacterium]
MHKTYTLFTVLFCFCACLLNAQECCSIAAIYYWKAKPGKLEAYNRYIREVAAPIDAEAQKQGAFVSVTTYVSHKADSPWTHMRIFIVKDKAQLENLSSRLDAAAARLEPEEAKRKARSEYAATLRDPAGQEVVDILHDRK